MSFRRNFDPIGSGGGGGGGVPTTRQVATAPGLTGGGDLSADRTIGLQVYGYFDAVPSAGISISNNTDTQLTLDSENADDANWYSTATGRYTPQRAGKYRFDLVITFGSIADGDKMNLWLYKNGSRVANLAGLGAAGGSVQTLSGSITTTANGTTDYFEIWTRVNAAGSRSVGSGDATHFSGYYIGA